jgi:peptide/nickel transport system substrate-binding protein
MKRYWTVIFLLLMVFSQAGCAPPPKSGPGAKYGASIPQGSGQAIISVTTKTRPPFRTVEQNGTEFLEARGEVGRFGGTFSTSQIGDGPKTFNPWVSTDATSSMLGGMLFSGLVSTDAYSGEVVPYLAKDVKLDADKMTYTVTLRKGLKWSDGKPLTAKDVVFTWNEIIKPGFGNASQRDVVMVDGKFPEIKMLDDLTIQFKTAKPFVPFMRNLSVPIAPEHILKPVVAQGNAAFSAFWGVNAAEKHPEKFVGAGLWLLKSYDPRLQVNF